MSRIGKLPINIPAGVNVTLKDNVVSVKGPKGELSQAIHPSIIVNIENNEITFSIDESNDSVDNKQKQAFHGLYRALVNNMVVGVSTKSRLRRKPKETRTRIFALSPATSNSWDLCAQKFVLSASPNLTRARVSCSSASRSAESPASLQVLSNFKTIRL